MTIDAHPPVRTDPLDLLARVRASGDVAAQEKLLERYMPLARKLAARWANDHAPFEDLLQVATLGLLKAMRGYDPGRGAPFVSYAIPTMLGELKRFFRDTGWSLHVPRTTQELALRVQAGERELSGRMGRSPSVVQVAQYLELSTEEVIAGLDAAHAHFCASLDAPASSFDDESTAESLGELLGGPDDGYGLVETRLSLGAAVARLPVEERQVLALRMRDGRSQHQIAAELGCSQMQVSRLLARARTHVRGMLGD